MMKRIRSDLKDKLTNTLGLNSTIFDPSVTKKKVKMIGA